MASREIAGRALVRRAFTEMWSERLGASRILFSAKEAALLHASIAMQSIPQALQAFLMIAGGLLGVFLAISCVKVLSTPEDAQSELQAEASREPRLDSRAHEMAERGAPGRRF